MKKTVIITLIIFVASFILTICFGVALGANGFKEIIEGDGLEKLFSKIEIFEDRFENIGDSIENRVDFDTDDVNSKRNCVYEEIDEQECTKDTIVIGSDASEIIVMPSDGETRIAEMKIFSRINTRYQCNDFSLEVNFDGYDVYVKENEKNAVTSAKLYVYIPECVKNVVVKSSAGEIELENLNLSSIDISLDAGEVDISGTTADKCTVNVDAGELELEKGFSAYEVNACVNTGNIKYELPTQGSTEINYSVNIGTVKLDKELALPYKIYDKNGKEVKAPASEGKIETLSAYSSLLTKADFKVSVGNIEIE